MLRAKDVMTTKVVSVKPDSTVGAVADVLVKHRFSAVPVVDRGKLVGTVSEGDLVRRAEIGTDAGHRSWWWNIFRDNASLAAEYTKFHSANVADVMTQNVATVTEITPLSDVADLLQKRRIKQVPVMRFGEMVGIVSRADLVRAFAATTAKGRPLGSDDDVTRTRILEALKAERWSLAGNPQLAVSDGGVTFWGVLGSEEERKASRVLAENVEGVRRVEDHRVMIEFPIVAI
ncbi:CBS domain-containing protein [Mesorhizobium mediterraneum]|uniref:CBS domain-containing protein n=1 Tax=Mesorhizobium mediterraneum TaxID=43617 RepID=UPI001784A39D|nr:CBS domain-containing protein [Mesorhizobium mediterraneum]